MGARRTLRRISLTAASHLALLSVNVPRLRVLASLLVSPLVLALNLARQVHPSARGKRLARHLQMWATKHAIDNFGGLKQIRYVTMR